MDQVSLLQLTPRRHDYQHVHITVFIWNAVGVRAEKDDFVRFESLGNLARETPDDAQGYIRPAIVLGDSDSRSLGELAAHDLIIGSVAMGRPIWTRRVFATWAACPYRRITLQCYRNVDRVLAQPWR